MKTRLSETAIFQPGFQCKADAGECDFVPGNFFFEKKPGLEALMTRPELLTHQGCTKKHMYLSCSEDIHDGAQIPNPDFSQRFLAGFSRRALSQCFAVFHETRRHGPESMTWFDRSSAQKDLLTGLGYAADDYPGVFVVNSSTSLAHGTRQAIACGDFFDDLAATLAAIIHVCSLRKRRVGES